METVPSHASRTSRLTPRPSLPNTSPTGPARSSSVYGSPAGLGGVHPEIGVFHRVDGPLEVGLPRDAYVLARPRARLDRGRRYARGAVFRDDDPAGPCAVGGPQDGPEVARVGDAVEEEDQGIGRREDLLQPGVRIRLDAGHDTLMNPAPRQLIDPLSGDPLVPSRLACLRPSRLPRSPTASKTSKTFRRPLYSDSTTGLSRR